MLLVLPFRHFCYWLMSPPLTDHFGFAHYCTISLPCSYFAIGQSQYHVTFSMYIYSSLACESLFLYLCYLRISCPFPVLHDWVDKWLRNPLSLFSLPLSLSIYSIPPCPPIARNYRRQLLQGHSLRCKLSSLHSHMPSPVLVLGRHALAMGDLPGVEIMSHQSRAVALTITSLNKPK